MSILGQFFPVTGMNIVTLDRAILSLSPRRYYRCNESASPLVDSGSDGVNANLSVGAEWRWPSILPSGENMSAVPWSTGYFTMASVFTWGANLTFSFPMKRNGVPGASKCIWSQYSIAGSAGGIIVNIEAAGRIRVDGKVPGSATYEGNIGTRNVCDNSEHYITVILRNNKIELWIDGVLDVWSSGDGAFNGNVYYSAGSLIGQINSSQYWNSSIQNLAWWDKALSYDQVQYLWRAAQNRIAPYQNAIQIPYTPIMGWRKPIDIISYEIDWSNPLTRGLSHYLTTVGGAVVNLANGEKWRTNQNDGDVDLAAPSPYGISSTKGSVTNNQADAPIVNIGYRPVKTSDGAGTGAVTMMSFGAPRAENNRRMMMSQYNSTATQHISMMANTTTDGSVANGYFAFQTYAATYQGIAWAGVVDGGYHVYLGTRDDTAFFRFFVDGAEVNNGQRSIRDVFTMGTNLYMYYGGYQATTSFAVRDPILLNAVWERALSAGEAYSISRNPWQILKPVIHRSTLTIPEVFPRGVWLNSNHFNHKSVYPSRRQPQGRLKIDWDNPLARGLRYAWVWNADYLPNAEGTSAAGSDFIELVSGQVVTSGGATDLRSIKTNRGHALFTYNSAPVISVGPRAKTLPVQGASMLMSAFYRNYGIDHAAISQTAAAGTLLFWADTLGGNLRPACNFTGTVQYGKNFSAFAEGEPITWGGVVNGADSFVVNHDGTVTGGTNTGNTAGQTLTGQHLFTQSGSSKHASANHHFMFFFDVPKTEAEMRALWADPYQLVIAADTPPVPSYTIVAYTPPVGDGGSTTPGAHVFYEKFLERIGDGSINLSTAVLRCALVSDLYSSPPGGGAAATDPRWGLGGDQDLSANEVYGGAYPQGGVAIDGTDPWALSTPQAVYTAQTASFAAGSSIDTDVKLLLHMDGTDASTTFTDSSSFTRTITPVGNAQIDTANPKFGTAAGLFDGTGDYLSVPHDTVFNLDTSFTMDGYVYVPTSHKAIAAIASKRNGANGWMLYLQNSGDLTFAMWNTGAGVYVQIDYPANPLSVDTYHHVEVGFDGTTFYLFLNGTLVDSTSTVSGTLSTNTNALLVGRDSSNTARDWNGHIDDFRIVTGRCLHTTSFTPPTHEANPSTPPEDVRWAVIYDEITRYPVSYVMMYDGATPLSLASQPVSIRWNNGVTSGTMFHATQA